MATYTERVQVMLDPHTAHLLEEERNHRGVRGASIAAREVLSEALENLRREREAAE